MRPLVVAGGLVPAVILQINASSSSLQLSIAVENRWMHVHAQLLDRETRIRKMFGELI
jgi:hypothetical protein